ncbi:hypothetical protein, partial [Planotetraspora kaengkrachanensis]|uniref:hypothetical protein n=1 Tax=Planotetraspora kaengkrachanensis TaxID=575193 RepID=UPI0031E53300
MISHRLVIQAVRIQHRPQEPARLGHLRHPRPAGQLHQNPLRHPHLLITEPTRRRADRRPTPSDNVPAANRSRTTPNRANSAASNSNRLAPGPSTPH